MQQQGHGKTSSLPDPKPCPSKTMTYRVYFTEVSRGYVEFDTKEHAEVFAKDPSLYYDYDAVNWIKTELTNVSVEPELKP